MLYRINIWKEKREGLTNNKGTPTQRKINGMFITRLLCLACLACCNLESGESPDPLRIIENDVVRSGQRNVRCIKGHFNLSH